MYVWGAFWFLWCKLLYFCITKLKYEILFYKYPPLSWMPNLTYAYIFQPYPDRFYLQTVFKIHIILNVQILRILSLNIWYKTFDIISLCFVVHSYISDYFYILNSWVLGIFSHINAIVFYVFVLQCGRWIFWV